MANKKLIPNGSEAEYSDGIRLYTTLAGEGAVELIEKKSRFIGYAAHVTTEAEAADFIRKIRSVHYDATHNIYAYSLAGGSLMRYSDDGEPQGTAGIPTLDVIRKSGVDDAVVVVTRYFGGTLLGAGGLVRAYSAAASHALDAAKIVTYEGYTEFSMKCGYSEYQKVQYELPQYGVIIDDVNFGENVELTLAVKDRYYFRFEDKIKEIFNGRLQLIVIGSRFDYK